MTLSRHDGDARSVDDAARYGALSDRDVTDCVVVGEEGAFAELYRRHAESAWRVAYAVTGNPHDAADAVSEAFARVLRALVAGRLRDGAQFRPYLAAAARNAAIDVLRRSERIRPTDNPDVLDALAHGPAPADRMVDAFDSAMMARAFKSLPERWRSVLWLTEVEAIPVVEAASILGLSPNGLAQLAVRARAGLRQRFVQAHVDEKGVASGCRFTVQRLGSYVTGELPPRSSAKVDRHVLDCATCKRRRSELADLGAVLRRVSIALPVGLALATLEKMSETHRKMSFVRSSAGALPRQGLSTHPRVDKRIGIIALAILLGLSGSAVLPGHLPRLRPTGPSNLAVPAPDSPATGGLLSASRGNWAPPGGADDGSSRSTTPLAPPPAESAPDAANPTDPPRSDGVNPPTTPADQALVQVRVEAIVAGLAGSFGVGVGAGSCTGINTAREIGCAPAPANSPLAVSSGGRLLPPFGISIP
jgi:RNA polymerase sigma factor (sigma-70 family)